MSFVNEDYNLMGHGIVRPMMYQDPKKLYEFLNFYNFENKLHDLKQLGSIRHFLKGAHYTRYEYMLLQVTLIHELKKKHHGFGLGSKVNSEELKMNGKALTVGDILQCLAILTNTGHFPDTYTASKVWLHLLKINKNKIRSTFRGGLCGRGKSTLDRIISGFDYYQIHLLNMVFLLRRYRRKDANMVNFGENLLLSYINRDNKELNNFLRTYNTIRKISYLLLDSHYAPIPFKLDFPYIMLMLDDEEDRKAITNTNSMFNKSLGQIRGLLESTLYLSPETMLYKSKRSSDIKKKFSSLVKNDLTSVTDVESILTTQDKGTSYSTIFGNENKHYIRIWDENIIDIKYEPEVSSDYVTLNTLEIEERINSDIGNSLGTTAIEITPDKRLLRISCAINHSYSQNKVEKSTQVINELIKLDRELKKKGFNNYNEQKKEFESSLLEFLLKYCFLDKYETEFLHNNFKTPPFFIARGSRNITNEINDFISENKYNLGKNEIHELKTTSGKIESMGYQGLILAYLGSLNLREANEDKAEFDGIIFIPNLHKENFLYVIEAKNARKGRSRSINQLNDRLKEVLCNKRVEFSVEGLGDMDAIASLKFSTG